jgi:hypothetical protein
MWGKKVVEVELLEPDVLPKQELRRRAIVPQLSKNETHQLALKAASLLGYTTLATHVGASGPLAHCLQGLDIGVFNEEEVKRYQEYMLHKVAKKLSSYQTANWGTRDLRYYTEPVPEFALRKAIQIKERLPEAQFFIEALQIGFKTADPFMKVTLDNKNTSFKESYYIEVWDEPEFEIKL